MSSEQTKCENAGSGTGCKTCAIKRRPCEYKDAPAPPNSGGTYPHSESITEKVDRQPKKRKRTIAPNSGVVHGLTGGLRTHENLLDSPWLVPKVWIELILESIATRRIRRHHFSENWQGMITASTPRRSVVASVPGSDSTISWQTPITFWLTGVDEKPSLVKAQALLFLAYHQFTAMQGDHSWIKIGNAIGMIQVLGYQNNESRRDFDTTDKNDDSTREEAFIDWEIRRRTVWSCFILDRLTSCGKHRPRGLNVEDLTEIQLPCSDKAFSRGIRVRTRRLGETDQKYAQRRELVGIRHLEHADGSHDDAHKSRGNKEVDWEVGATEGELSFYVQAVNHFGNIMRWSYRSRQQEPSTSYENGSKFRELEENGRRLKYTLPRHLTLAPQNTSHHISYKSVRNYLLIHALHTLCTMALYREYMAFLPFNVKRPQGPLDEPRIDEKKFPLPYPDYWVNQARKCFGDARNFADLLKACRAANALAESPFTGFTCYIVSWCALYCHFFPRMDPDRALDSRLQPSVWNTTNDVIVDMEARFINPNQWLALLVQIHRFFKMKRAAYFNNDGFPGSTGGHRSRDGSLNHHIRLFESAHKGIGSVTGTWNSTPVNRDVIKVESYDLNEAESPASPKPFIGSARITAVSSSLDRAHVWPTGLKAPTHAVFQEGSPAVQNYQHSSNSEGTGSSNDYKNNLSRPDMRTESGSLGYIDMKRAERPKNLGELEFVR
ncbi:hypothetical protein EK21DRAFT_94590 [Setomelanomma holmii]|uniref:Xylanolytic transcriptional activator regulatory domain-containing protein n=1 Tax=Setomelanomma holmii TaxID=210430 RepID=A0A9P4GYG7_9PLEO|nr:hypothetical protein EK21DRAFT_94590 [Setomelanomma holmii]